MTMNERPPSAPPTLSYVLATKDRLSRLQRAIERVLRAIQPDEEIVIFDGGSTDGSTEWLRLAAEQDRRITVVSEADRGEAHAYNKAILLSRGRLIKPLTDDDIFQWAAIAECKAFMLARSDVHALGTNGIGTVWHSEDPFVKQDYDAEFLRWAGGGPPFAFSGLGLMIRRESLPLLGLFDTRCTWVDYEFTIRATALRANVAWYRGAAWLRVGTPQSNSAKFAARLQQDRERIDLYYGARTEPTTDISTMARAAGTMAALKRRWRRGLARPPSSTEAVRAWFEPLANDPEMYAMCEAQLAALSESPGEPFLCRDERMSELA
jgi:glycosyltransferase involved in cell wall biosynthesis